MSPSPSNDEFNYQASSVNFLSKNLFDFNKLFSQAISYTPYLRKEKLKEECKFKVTKTFPSMRSYTSLSTSHEKKLQQMMEQIDDWVYDSNSGETLTFNISSYSLKKALGKEVTKLYLKTGVFTEYQRSSSETIVKKSKTFRQHKFMRGAQPNVTSDDGNNSQSSLGFQISDEEEKQLKEQKKSQTSSDEESLKKAELNEQKQIYEHEYGFTKVIELLMKCGKPLVGHNMIFDLGFIYRQFISASGNLPASYPEFAKLWKQYFPQTVYDTKVLAQYCGTNIFGKTSLDKMWINVEKQKQLRNNLTVEGDKAKDTKFSIYDDLAKEKETKEKTRFHDGGYDAYITGKCFLSISKYIEIGKIVVPKDSSGVPISKPNSQNTTTTTSTKSKATPKQDVMSQQIKPKKRGPTMTIDDLEEDKEVCETAESSRRKIKHYSMVQNKQLYYDDLKEFEDKIMLNIDVPRYFYLKDCKLSDIELEFEKRMKDTVIWVLMKEEISAQKIASLFNVYGDINVVKNTSHSCYVEFSFIDSDIVQGKKIAALIKKAEQDLDKSNKGLIAKITTYDHATRYVCTEPAIPLSS